MIEFDENGFLKPYKVIETNLATFERVFVEEMPFSTTRKMIFDNYLRYLETLQKLIKEPFFQWIDGSFVTMKRNPNDIDLVTFIDFELYNIHLKEIELLRSKRLIRGNVIDGYFVAQYPTEHPKNNIYELELKEWLFQFSTSRTNKNKGILQITF